MKMKILLLFFAMLIPLSGDTVPEAFRQYWYKGKAELTRYSLEQARYGEIHRGDAVLIFVTEPFLSEKQVKKESTSNAPAVSVLKLNLTKKFFTGIYPYSLMTSVFTPVDYGKNRTLKVASSIQEWCGQTYSQLNLRNDRYKGIMHSYFEEEADQTLEFNTGWLEDEIWTRIRIAPETLPVGEINIVPALQFVQLGHSDLKPEKAMASRKNEGKIFIYVVDYKTINRSLTIRFESSFPHAILSWEEKGAGGFGPNAPVLTTRGVKTHSLMLDYWNKHRNQDAPLREKLGLK